MLQRSLVIPVLLLGLAGGIFSQSAFAQTPPRDPSAAVQATRSQMEAASGGAVHVTQSPTTKLATFLAATPGKPIPLLVAPTTPPEERGRKFLHLYGAAFGISALDQVRVQRVQDRDEAGMEHVRFQQVLRGIPVRGGEIIVHLHGANTTAVTAKTLPDLAQVETKPQVSPQDAIKAAQEVLAKHLQVSDASLSTPQLEIFNQGLFEGRPSPTRLAWFIEATKLNVREFIWVDAQRGVVLLHFSQLTDAKNRQIHDANVLPGTLVRSEGQTATADVDADAAYDFSGDTYDYFFTQHGRDSYDGAGAPLISTVDSCPFTFDCPYQNAFWNGEQMVYGAGFSLADDVDAHELTHAVTEKSANLVYFSQSGALNESFSDIFGETVDLTNSGGTDTAAVRWQLGEDIPNIGAIRNMMNPTLFGDPGKVSDPQFICNDPEIDSGGVHINSGVPNHAYALMVDGGTYNGQTITGIGLTKAGKIQYRTLTTYLVSTADFPANYTAVQQACADLIGIADITSADCAEVKKALDAVEMSRTFCSPLGAPALCPTGQEPTTLFFDNLENPTSGKWTTATASGVNHWLDDSNHTAAGGCTGTPDMYCTVPGTSGIRAFWGYDFPIVGDSVVAMTQNVTIPLGARLQFNHLSHFENSTLSFYDGGVVEYSANGGASWTDAGALVSAGAAYNGVISSGWGNPLAGRNAFVADSPGYLASQLNLGSLAGQSVRFRFRMGTDSSVADLGWFIDDVHFYTCSGGSPKLSVSDVTKVEGNSGPTTLTFTVSLSPASSSQVRVTYATANGTAFAPTDYTALPATVLTFAAGETSKSVTVTVNGDTSVEGNETFHVNLSNAIGATIADGQGLGTITNDDLAKLSINDVTKVEGNSGTTLFTFTVTLNPAAASTVAVQCVSADGSATAASDYSSVNKILTFLPGQTSQPCSVAGVGDTSVEGNETFSVNLSGAVGAEITDGQGIGTITNDDLPRLSITDAAQAEGSNGPTVFTFFVALSAPSTNQVKVTYASLNGSAAAPTDYTALPATLLTFAPGETSKTVNVTVNGDTTVEGNETFSINLSGAIGATIADGQGIGTIANDDLPKLSINDMTRVEGSSGTALFTFTVTLSPAATSTITVRCASSDGSATAPSDYSSVDKMVTFLTGQSSQPCAVSVVGDTTVEGNETFSVNLNNAVGATIADGQGIGTITNDDLPKLSITDVTQVEGSNGLTTFTFTVNLSAPSPNQVKVNYASLNSTASAPTDYTALPVTVLTFAPGETSKTVTVMVNGDTTVEGNETFSINLSSAAGATIIDTQGKGTIMNDD